MNIPILDELLAELGAVTPGDVAVSIERTDEIAPDDKRIGNLSPNQLALEALCFKLTGRAAQRALEAHFQVSDPHGHNALLAEAQRLKHMAEMARVILWGHIQDEYGWSEQKPGMKREGGAIILIRQENEKLPGLLLKLLQGS